ncbi:MAG: GNAT family N-acetyltransferase, partial [Parasporobacterium sp.]|nr:GNAT family N-acetyltransferase [Parasporobacterium sp.]
MLSLKKVQNKDRDLLWNINQKYLYEMTNFYDDPMDENGNYHYGYFDEYFSDPKRKAYFICNDGVLVGFAMLCPYSNIEQDPDYTMAEFTIFPSFRRRHLALDAAKMILARHPGKWEIKYNEKNRGAKNLWHTVAGPYEPEIYHLNEEETVLLFETEGKIIAACGNDCAACPRYTTYPYEKTEEELHHTAELWMKIG